MSEKTAKQQRKEEEAAKAAEEAAQKKAQKTYLEQQIKKAHEDIEQKEKTCDMMVENTLLAASDKYRTVHGFMQCRETLMQASGLEPTDMKIKEHAYILAADMSDKCKKFLEEYKKQESLDDIDEFVMSQVDNDFISDSHSDYEVAKELATFDMINNVIGHIHDRAGYVKGQKEAIEAYRKDLAELDI